MTMPYKRIARCLALSRFSFPAGIAAAAAFVCMSLTFPLIAQEQGNMIHGMNGVTLPPPPAVAVKPITDAVNGATLTDNYRWLEDQKAPETRAYIDAQMAYTQSYLGQVKDRPAIAKRLAEMARVDSYSPPTERGGKYFFKKRLAAENQASIYMRVGLHGQDVRLVDATKLSADQNSSVSINDVSEDGSILVYGVRQGGADEQSVHLVKTADGKAIADVLPAARYGGVNLSPDNQGLYYAKFTNEGSLVYHHALGTPVEQDALIFGKEYKGAKLGPLDLIGCGVTENGHYLVLSVSHGVPATREDILLKDLRHPESEIVPLVYGVESRFDLAIYDDEFFVQTDYHAPNYRVLKAVLGDPDAKTWTEIVPESKNVINEISIVGGKLFVSHLVDVKTETTIYSLDGKKTGSIAYPGIGDGSVVRGRQHAATGFYSFQSFTVPQTIYSYNIATGKTDVFAAANVPFDSSKYEVRQVFYTSKDGTRVPMFIAGRKGLKLDGNAPLLMTAYGGFNISYTPSFNSEYAWWMEQGGFFALPNLRGGGEYGEAWHKGGMFQNKQNVFDDFYAAAEYLIANKYTTANKLAIFGRSNGGLLMGAAMTQRPDLFGAIMCGYPLLDMARFQNFLVGRWWTTEYGSAEDPSQAGYILKYSPYQNVKAGTKYPAIMFLTGDSDTRVDPLHARKMAALMQATVMAEPAAERRPVLLHYDTKAGHSAGVSVDQAVKDGADELAFLWNETGGK